MIVQILDTGELPISIYLDLPKALDTLDHHIIFPKLNYYSITGTPLKWFHNYLTNRTQFVQFDDVHPQALQMSTSVPQGSILRPLLFIIYINDMHMQSSQLDSTLYVDDNTLVNYLVCSLIQIKIWEGLSCFGQNFV